MIIIIIISMLMPIQHNSLHIYESYRYSLTAAFWPNLTGILGGWICLVVTGCQAWALRAILYC
jgi:hypothetical protein